MSGAAKFSLLVTGIILIVVILKSTLVPMWNEHELNQSLYDSGKEYSLEGRYYDAFYNFRLLGEYKDSKQLMIFLEEGIYNEGKKMLGESKYDEAYTRFLVLKDNQKYPDIDELIGKAQGKIKEGNEPQIAKKKAELGDRVPYEGMSEYDIEYTKWGLPTSIEKSSDYDAMREQRRYKTYKWKTATETREVIVSESKAIRVTSYSNKK